MHGIGYKIINTGGKRKEKKNTKTKAKNINKYMIAMTMEKLQD